MYPGIALHAHSQRTGRFFGLRQAIAGSSSHPAESSSFSCGPPVRLQLLSTPPRDDAVTFDYRALAYPDADLHRANVAPSRAHDRRTAFAMTELYEGLAQASISSSRQRRIQVRSAILIKKRSGVRCGRVRILDQQIEIAHELHAPHRRGTIPDTRVIGSRRFASGYRAATGAERIVHLPRASA